MESENKGRVGGGAEEAIKKMAGWVAMGAIQGTPTPVKRKLTSKVPQSAGDTPKIQSFDGEAHHPLWRGLPKGNL